MANLQYPFGAADILTLSATGAQALTISDKLTIIDGVTTQATGNRTINLTISSELQAGAEIIVKSKTNATETTVFGTGCIAATITGVAGKTKTKSLVYDGTNFIGINEQID
jgi:hypothetical protein